MQMPRLRTGRSIGVVAAVSSVFVLWRMRVLGRPEGWAVLATWFLCAAGVYLGVWMVARGILWLKTPAVVLIVCALPVRFYGFRRERQAAAQRAAGPDRQH